MEVMAQTFPGAFTGYELKVGARVCVCVWVGGCAWVCGHVGA
jgi:hypothetical protein